MKSLPDEYELLALFECEPVLRDTQTKNLPFYYNQATYRFSNEEEAFLVILEPAYGEVKIQVNQKSTNRLISRLDLKRVDSLEIKADSKKSSSILLTLGSDETFQTLEIQFKPNFKLILQDHLEY